MRNKHHEKKKENGPVLVNDKQNSYPMQRRSTENLTHHRETCKRTEEGKREKTKNSVWTGMGKI